MAVTVTSPDGLRWKVRRLIVPTGLRPLGRVDMVHAATPRRTFVDGVDRGVPDATGAWTGPLPIGFLFTLLFLPLVPPVLLLRRLGLLPWTIEARAHPWGRGYPPMILTYLVRGGAESCQAIERLCARLAAGDGAPVLEGAQRVGQERSPHDGDALVGTSGPKQFGA